MAERRASMPRPGPFLLLAAIFAAAACAIVYELLIGSLSSYFLGDSVEQFSLTIGFFLFAMGVGSWLSRLVKADLIARFIALEFWLGLVGGSAVGLLYMAYAYGAHFRYWMLVLVLLIGALIGLEIPILTRILRAWGPLRAILSSVLSLDYLGALIAALLFPYVLMPVLGNMHTSLVAGLVNWGVGVALLLCFWSRIRRRARRLLLLQGGGAGLLLLGLLLGAKPLLARWESALYSDRIIYSEQSPYQKIVLTRWSDDLRLYLNGHLQFSSVDEYRYHEALVHPALSLAAGRRRVLIVGGGDGLSAREVLKYPEVEEIDLVDLDAAVTRLAGRNLNLTRLNKNALNRPRVRILNEDGFLFLQRAHEAYNAIIIDLPDPREPALSKLYSVEGYRLCRRQLAPGGVLVTQATSPYYARRTYWSIAATLEEAGFRVYSYHALVPSFGEWGFHLAALEPLKVEAVEFKVPRRYLRAELFRAMLLFDADMAPVAAQPNRLDKPLLAHYYRQDWSRW